MTLRTRFIMAITAVNAMTLGFAFIAMTFLVNRSQERQLDEALRREALEEAEEISAQGGRKLRITPRLRPAPDDVGPLTEFAVLYGASGAILDSTSSWNPRVPTLETVPRSYSNLVLGETRLRALLVDVPRYPGVRLLLAAPRTDLDRDAAFLRRSTGSVFGLALLATMLLISVIIRRLTRVHQRVADVARRVAAEDLSARVGPVSGDREIVALAKNVDDMVERLEFLLRSQQRFIANAAHELRSPLTALYGVLSQALRRSRDNASYRDSIREALDSTEQLKVLAEDLLALARLGNATEERVDLVDLTEVCRDAIASLHAEAKERGVMLVFSCESMVAQGRRLDLVRVVRNLVENAIRHAPAGSSVAVRGVRSGLLAEVTVTDSGPGVPPGDEDRVFQPFFRGALERSQSVGTGLGLAIAREIAVRHRGVLQLRPSETGACFVFAIPLA